MVSDHLKANLISNFLAMLDCGVCWFKVEYVGLIGYVGQEKHLDQDVILPDTGYYKD